MYFSQRMKRKSPHQASYRNTEISKNKGKQNSDDISKDQEDDLVDISNTADFCKETLKKKKTRPIKNKVGFLAHSLNF